MEIATTLLLIGLLILLNGVFVAAEFAIIGTPRSTLEAASSKGEKTARRLAKIKTNTRRQDRFITTAQLGITLASLGLGMYGEHAIAAWLARFFSGLGTPEWIGIHSISSLISIGLLTYLHVVAGEMIPKSLALKQPYSTAVRISPVILLTDAVFYPVISILNGIGSAILRAMGIRRTAANPDQFRTPEELSYIVEESQVGGQLREESATVFMELLEFGDLIASEVMIPRTMVVGIPNDADDSMFQKILTERPHSRYPIYVETLDQIIGIVHVKDLLDCLPNCAGQLPSILRPVPFVPHSLDLEEVLKTMTRAHSQMAIVMDEQGGTAGIITIEDLFEEVVGDIRESAAEKPEIYLAPDGQLHVAGTVRIEDLGYELGIELEHEDVDTVSGLVLALLGRPALVGDEVEHQGVHLQVASTKGRGVRECIAWKTIQSPQET